MIKYLAVPVLVAICSIAWASEPGIPKKADHPVATSKTAEEASAGRGVVTQSSSIGGGTMSSGNRSAVIQDSSGTILVIGQSGVAEIRYGTSKKELEKIAKAKALPLKKVSDNEWVMGVNGAHIIFKNGKVAGEKLNLTF